MTKSLQSSIAIIACIICIITLCLLSIGCTAEEINAVIRDLDPIPIVMFTTPTPLVLGPTPEPTPGPTQVVTPTATATTTITPTAVAVSTPEPHPTVDADCRPEWQLIKWNSYHTQTASGLIWVFHADLLLPLCWSYSDIVTDLRMVRFYGYDGAGELLYMNIGRHTANPSTVYPGDTTHIEFSVPASHVPVDVSSCDMDLDWAESQWQ